MLKHLIVTDDLRLVGVPRSPLTADNAFDLAKQLLTKGALKLVRDAADSEISVGPKRRIAR
jgi:hypothetical protein